MIEKRITIPRLRFPEFGGEWERKMLAEIFEISAGGDIKKENISQIKSEKFKYPIYANAEKDKGFFGYSDVYKIKENVVTVAGRGVNYGIAHARNHKFYPIVRLLILKPKHSEDIYFFEYQINQLNLFKESTGVPQLTAPQISNYKIFYPSLPEQQKIASFFTAIDKKITQLKRKKNLLEQYKKGVMQKIFSQEIWFTDENGKEYPGWEKKKIKDMAEIKYGKDQKQISCENGMYPILGTGGEMGRTNDFLSDKPSVLIGRKGTIDKPRYMDTPFWTVDTLFYTDVFANTNPKWLFYKFETINWYLYNEASGVPSLSSSTIYNISIYLPSISEQTKIANFLSAIDDKIDQTQMQIEKAEIWKKGLLQKMFV